MTIDTLTLDRMRSLVEPSRGLVDRRLFSDPDIYQLELEQIFARAWNFVAHDSQIPNPGDFFMTFVGEDRVIVVRDNDMQPQVLVNSCRHRGNAVCRAEEGHTTSFMCTYHGWTYDLKGALVGVPGFKEVYHEELDRENWGLIKPAQVDSYHGFIFANMDPEAPNLQDYLGDVGRLSLDHIAARGEMRIIGGVQKYTLPCNWKLAADNVWDYYHTTTSHAASIAANYTYVKPGEKALNPITDRSRFTQPHTVIPGEYGHAISGYMITEDSTSLGAVSGRDEPHRKTEEAQRLLGPVGIKVNGHPHVFPNMWMTGTQVSLRVPKGPTSTEIWWFTFLEADLDDETRRKRVNRANHTFGPAGILEQEDGENWGESTKAAKGVISKQHPLNYAMNLGLGEVIIDELGPPRVETRINEHAQLWYYRAWADWMSASSWQELREHHADVPRQAM